MVPVTQGILRNRVSDMLIGDYIAANFKNGVYTAIGEMADTTLADFDSSNPGAEGLVYLIKTQKGLLIPNMVQIPSNTQSGMELFYYLNKKGMIAGADVTIPEQYHIAHYTAPETQNNVTDAPYSVAPGLDPDPTLVWETIEPENVADAIANGRTIYYYKTDGSYTTDSTDIDIDMEHNVMSPAMVSVDFQARVRIPDLKELVNAFVGHIEYTAHTSKTETNFYNGGTAESEMVVPRGVSIGATDQFGYFDVTKTSELPYSTFSDNTTTYPARLVLEFVDNEFSVDFDH